VYDSVPYSGQSGWFQVGGTSAGAPQWSALVAIADQGRQLAGQGSLDGASQTLPRLYALASNPTSYASDINDITTGSNAYYTAGPGYDLVTGLGTPVANHLVLDLVLDATAAQAVSSGSSPTAVGGSSSGTGKTSVLPGNPSVPPIGSPGTGGNIIAFLNLGTGGTNARLQVTPLVAPLSAAGAAATFVDSSTVRLPAPRSASGAAGDGSGLPVLDNDRPEAPARAESAPGQPGDRPATPLPSNPGDRAGRDQAALQAWHLACDLCFADDDRQVGSDDENAAALLILPKTGPGLDSAAGLAALAFVLAGSWKPPAEPEIRRRRCKPEAL
jgi:hypothetical protein